MDIKRRFIIDWLLLGTNGPRRFLLLFSNELNLKADIFLGVGHSMPKEKAAK